MKYVVVLLTLLLMLGCEKDKPQEEPRFANPVMEKEFTSVVEQVRPQLRKAMKSFDITVKGLKENTDWLEYSVFEQTKSEKEKGHGFASVRVFGKCKLGKHELFKDIELPSIKDMELPSITSIIFFRRGGQWNLGLENGYLFGDKGEDGIYKHPPGLHSLIKQIFPNHIDLKTEKGIKLYQGKYQGPINSTNPSS